MKRILIKSGLMVATLVALVSCKKEYDAPPEKTIPVGKEMTIGLNNDSTKESLFGFYYQYIVDSGWNYYTFQDDYSLYATVTMGESTGNIYKETYIQGDDSVAFKLMLTSSSNMIAGDYIRIALKGTTIRVDNDVVLLDSVNPDLNIIKVATQQFIEPLEVDLADVGFQHENKLLKITNCEFERTAAAGKFANKGAGGASEYDLTDCDKNTLLVRTSDYCNFADDEVPDGNGYIIGVLGKYRTTLQFYIRDPKEINMPAEACAKSIVLSKTFDDASVTSGGWSEWQTGDAYWLPASFGSNNYAEVRYAIGESWLFSPVMDLSSYTTVAVDFETAFARNGNLDAFDVMVSNDYPGFGDPNQATWTELTGYNTQAASDSYNWTYSGEVDITSYVGSTTRVALKYKATSGSDDAHVEVDYINVLAK